MISLSDTLYAKIRQRQGETRLCLKRYKHPVTVNGPTKGYRPATLSMNLSELQFLLHYQKRLQIEMYVRHPAYQAARGAAAVSSALSAAEEGSTRPRLKREPRFYVYEERQQGQRRQRQQQQQQQQQQQRPRRQRRVKKTDLPTDVVRDTQSVEEDLVMTAAQSAGIPPVCEDQQQQQQQQPSGRWENPCTDTNSWLHPAYLAETDVDTEAEEAD